MNYSERDDYWRHGKLPPPLLQWASFVYCEYEYIKAASSHTHLNYVISPRLGIADVFNMDGKRVASFFDFDLGFVPLKALCQKYEDLENNSRMV